MKNNFEVGEFVRLKITGEKVMVLFSNGYAHGFNDETTRIRRKDLSTMWVGDYELEKIKNNEKGKNI